jgi:hypothetical protein
VTVAQVSLPFTVYWTYQDNSFNEFTTLTHTSFKNLLKFLVYTRDDGTQYLVIPMKFSDGAGNVTELDVTINVTSV